MCVYLWPVQSISRGQTHRDILWTVGELCKAFHGQAHRPDIEAIVAAGLFEECAAGIEAFAAGGTDQLHDMDVSFVFWALRLVLNCHSHPECEARIRSLATALEFCIEHDMDLAAELYVTTASMASSIGEPASARLKEVCAH